MENGPKEKKWAGNMPPDTPLVLGALGKGTNTLDVSHTNQLKHNEHYHACVVCVFIPRRDVHAHCRKFRKQKNNML